MLANIWKKYDECRDKIISMNQYFFSQVTYLGDFVAQGYI